MIIGCDISHHQGEAIDWNKMAAAGVKFIYIKCSQGIDIKDHDFEANMKGARSVGILPGPYHFVTADSPYKQYEWYLAAWVTSCLACRLPWTWRNAASPRHSLTALAAC